jgi:hypothetical protein
MVAPPGMFDDFIKAQPLASAWCDLQQAWTALHELR